MTARFIAISGSNTSSILSLPKLAIHNLNGSALGEGTALIRTRKKVLNLNNKLETISNLFEGSEIRSIWDSEKEEYYFSVVDVISALTDSMS